MLTLVWLVFVKCGKFSVIGGCERSTTTSLFVVVFGGVFHNTSSFRNLPANLSVY